MDEGGRRRGIWGVGDEGDGELRAWQEGEAG